MIVPGVPADVHERAVEAAADAVNKAAWPKTWGSLDQIEHDARTAVVAAAPVLAEPYRAEIERFRDDVARLKRRSDAWQEMAEENAQICNDLRAEIQRRDATLARNRGIIASRIEAWAETCSDQYIRGIRACWLLLDESGYLNYGREARDA